jgi:histidinol-phosphatase (PHP family)
LVFNYHTHCHYCDGKEPPEQYVLEALDQGFQSLGFSSHAPVPFENKFSIAADMLPEYCSEIRSLKEKYRSQLDIFLALEADYIPGITSDLEKLREQCGLDYIIGGIHLVRPVGDERLWFIDGSLQLTYDSGLAALFGNDARKAVTAYYHQVNEMLEEQRPDIVAHIDKIKMHNKGRFFDEGESWYRNLAYEALRLMQETGCILEINSRGLYKQRCNDWFPSAWILEQALHLDIPVTISSDAHHPSELSLMFNETQQHLKSLGFREVVVRKETGWCSMAL